MKKIPIINQIIKDKKKELKINQIEFSEILQKSLTTIKRYDSGFPIPLDTLKIICDKLNLDILELLKKQLLENNFYKTKYYSELITKFDQIEETSEKLKDKNTLNPVKDKLMERLCDIFIFYYKNKKVIDFDIKFFNDKYYIKDKNGKTLEVFTIMQATELIKHFEDFTTFFIFKCRQENLNK